MKDNYVLSDICETFIQKEHSNSKCGVMLFVLNDHQMVVYQVSNAYNIIFKIIENSNY